MTNKYFQKNMTRKEIQSKLNQIVKMGRKNQQNLNLNRRKKKTNNKQILFPKSNHKIWNQAKKIPESNKKLRTYKIMRMMESKRKLSRKINRSHKKFGTKLILVQELLQKDFKMELFLPLKMLLLKP